MKKAKIVKNRRKMTVFFENSIRRLFLRLSFHQYYETRQSRHFEHTVDIRHPVRIFFYRPNNVNKIGYFWLLKQKWLPNFGSFSIL